MNAFTQATREIFNIYYKYDFFELPDIEQRRLIAAFIEDNYLQDDELAMDIITKSALAGGLPRFVCKAIVDEVAASFVGSIIISGAIGFVEERAARLYRETINDAGEIALRVSRYNAGVVQRMFGDKP